MERTIDNRILNPWKGPPMNLLEHDFRKNTFMVDCTNHTYLKYRLTSLS